ncbi:hypothetical protein ACLX1H_002155 [Fusarium chlamydosporum]
MDGSVDRLPPSEDEKDGYYYGLPSRPLLVARTSTEPWVERSARSGFWPLYKKLEVVRGHAIKDMWNDDEGPLRRDIINCLENVEWTAIDILRVGFEPSETGEKFDKPVTMLISVEKDSANFTKALATVTKCQEILHKHGIVDVPVEMKESKLVSCASSSESMTAQLPDVSTNPPTPKFSWVGLQV